MLNWKKTILPIAALAVAIPAGAFAASSDSTDNGSNAAPSTAPKADQAPGGQQNWKDKGKGFEGHGGRGHKGHMDGMMGGFGFMAGKGQNASVHQQTYYSLLAEKYAPDTTAGWDAAFAERQKLQEQLKSLKSSKDELRSTFEAKRKELQDKLQKGEITKEELQKQLQDLKGSFKGAPTGSAEDFKAEHEARQALQKQFTDAVASKDAEKIKAALTALLDQYKKDNQQLAAKIAELQANQQTQKTEPQATPAA